jgi:hypothetical protein
MPDARHDGCIACRKADSLLGMELRVEAMFEHQQPQNKFARIEAQHAKAKLRLCGSGYPSRLREVVHISAYKDRYFKPPCRLWKGALRTKKHPVTLSLVFTRLCMCEPPPGWQKQSGSTYGP